MLKIQVWDGLLTCLDHESDKIACSGLQSYKFGFLTMITLHKLKTNPPGQIMWPMIIQRCQKWIQDLCTRHVHLCSETFWVCIVNFDCITHIYFNCSQHAMCTIHILFSALTTKTGVCEEASKQSPDPKTRITIPPSFWNSWISHWLQLEYEHIYHIEFWHFSCLHIQFSHHC